MDKERLDKQLEFECALGKDAATGWLRRICNTGTLEWEEATGKVEEPFKETEEMLYLARQLIGKYGADVNAMGDVLYDQQYSLLPLHFAAQHGHVELCRMLIAAGAKLNATDNSKETALHFAALEGRNEVCRLLLEAGADVNACNYGNASPMAYAVNKPMQMPGYKHHKPLCRMLIEAGTDLDKHAIVSCQPVVLRNNHYIEPLLKKMVEEGWSFPVGGVATAPIAPPEDETPAEDVVAEQKHKTNMAEQLEELKAAKARARELGFTRPTNLGRTPVGRE